MAKAAAQKNKSEVKASKKAEKKVEKVEKVDKKAAKKAAKKAEEEAAAAKKAEEEAAAAAAAAAEEEEESSDSDDESKADSESDSEEDSESKDSEDSSSEGSANEEEPKTNNKRKAEESEDSEETPAKVAKVEEEIYTIWVGGLNYAATADDLRKHFAPCGNVVDVRVRMDNDTGKSRGFAHIDFNDKAAHQAALDMNECEHMGRTLRVDASSRPAGRFNEGALSAKTDKVFVANLTRDMEESELRSLLQESFSKFGTIVGDIGLPIDRETGSLRGIGYIQYGSENEAEAAVKGMSGVTLGGRTLRTDFSGGADANRGGNRGGRGGRGGRGDFRGGNRGGGRGRGSFRG
ncbi:hypothetical protein BDF14DRAFT_1979005 [Spinellus fusiger]|nr:hypothetical protein BDF14DRAFT_1979005 [Spinellus fusiger]